MDTLSAIKAMLDHSGLTPYEAAAKAGRSRTYVSNLFVRKTVPSAARLATIVEACGHRLAIVPGSAELPEGSITIDAADPSGEDAG